MIQSDDMEPRRIELDRKLGTDLHQTMERILAHHYQNPFKEETDEIEKVGVEMPYIQSQMHSDYDLALQTRILKLESYENAGLMYMGEEKLWLFSKTQSFTITSKEEKSKVTRSQTQLRSIKKNDHGRKLSEETSSSRAKKGPVRNHHSSCHVPEATGNTEKGSLVGPRQQHY